MINKINIKEQLLDSLEGNIVVTEIELEGDGHNNISIVCEFTKNNKKGNFRYVFIGEEYGTDYVRDYDEDDDENIYENIYDWVEEHFKWKISLKYNGKEM